MFYLSAGNVSAHSAGRTAADASAVDHDGNRLILIQIIAERSTLWEAIVFLDGGKSAGPLDRKINQ